MRLEEGFLKIFYFFIFLGLFFSCQEPSKKKIKEESPLESSNSFGLLAKEGCPVKTLRITLEGLIEEEKIALGEDAPLLYENMKCGGGLFLKFGSKKILLEKSLFSGSSFSLKKTVLDVEDVGLKTGDIEGISLEKEGVCIKNYETKKSCKDQSEGDQCLSYDVYEEERYKLLFLRVEADGVEIYNAQLDLMFNRDYELTWFDGDLLSAFWTKLHNCSE